MAFNVPRLVCNCPTAIWLETPSQKQRSDRENSSDHFSTVKLKASGCWPCRTPSNEDLTGM